ncbi:MAG: diguanylate cyclase [Novosphingobium sp.]
MDRQTDHSGEYAPSWNPLRWLGLGRGDASATPEAAIQAAASLSEPQVCLAEIARFLDQHGLAVTTVTLNVAWSYLTRSDEDLVLALDRRVRSGRGLTLEWLQDIHQRREISGEAVELRELMQRLEASVEEFGKSTREAHGAASEYHSALSGQIGELEQVAKASAVITEMAQIGKAMLRRTHEIERQMLRSSAQTRALKRRLDEARKDSEEDHLTGLPNRRAFEAVFENEYRAAEQVSEPLCVVFCDIDHFKRVNDEHGHDAGDRVLRLVAEMLAQVSDDRCHVARHGGEEFVVLMRGQTPAQTQARLDKVRSELAGRRLVNRATDTPFGQVTFSAGVAQVFDYADPRAALQAADAALYRAKLEGRNRILLAEAQDGERKLAA